MPGAPPPSTAALRLFYLAIFAVVGLYLPLLPPWLEARGVQGLAMGAAVATIPAMGVIAPPVFGLIADAWGLHGRLLRLASAGALAAIALLAIAAQLDVALGPAALFALVLAFAFFRAPIVPLADVIALELAFRAGTTYGRIRLWGSVGFALAAIVSGAWLNPARYAPLPTAIAAALALMLATSLFLPARTAAPPRPVPEHVQGLIRSADFRLFLAASLLGQAAHAAYDLCFTLHLRDLGVAPGISGAAWAIGVAAEIALMAGSGLVLARARPPALLAVAFAGGAIRWALLAVVRSPAVLLALQPLHGVSFGLMWIASVTYLAQRVAPHVLATAQGLFVASAATGTVIGMLAWGPIYRQFGGALTFGAASATAGLAFVLAVAYGRAESRWQREREACVAGAG